MCVLIYAGQDNPKEHDVYFDFDFDAVTSFQRILGVQESAEKQLLETIVTSQKRGRWVLRVQYSCERVRSTGFEQAMSMATPTQKAILMGLAQLMEVGEFTIHVREAKGFPRMLKRWEGFKEKRERDAAHVSLPPWAHLSLKAQLTHQIVESDEGCLHGRHPPQIMIAEQQICSTGYRCFENIPINVPGELGLVRCCTYRHYARIYRTMHRGFRASAHRSLIFYNHDPHRRWDS